MKSFIRKLIFWFCIGTAFIDAQTYSVGDTVDNFGATICQNDSGEWNYNTDGLHNVVWMNLFTSW